MALPMMPTQPAPSVVESVCRSYQGLMVSVLGSFGSALNTEWIVLAIPSPI